MCSLCAVGISFWLILLSFVDIAILVGLHKMLYDELVSGLSQLSLV